MTQSLPPTQRALNELRRTLAERREHQAKKPQPEGIARIMAMAEAVALIEICEQIIYFETGQS